MLRYAVVEISGRQYKVVPNIAFTVDNLGDIQTLECEKVLVLANDKLEIGSPYLNTKLVFDVLEHKKEAKIRVATFKAKANTRKVRGSRRAVTKIILKSEEKKSVKKED